MAVEKEVGNSASKATTDFEEWPTGVNEFPSIYRETTAMSLGAIIIFILSDLRNMARRGLLQENDNAIMLTLPIQGSELAPILERNRDTLKQNMKKLEYDVFEQLVRDYAIRSKIYQHEVKGAECYYIGDEHSSKECVYAIFLNHVRKNITVIFRGSITLQDWFQDGKTPFSNIENPLLKFRREDLNKHREKLTRRKSLLDFYSVLDKQPEEIPLHWGFQEYLYSKAPEMRMIKVQDIVDKGNDLLEALKTSASSKEKDTSQKVSSDAENYTQHLEKQGSETQVENDENFLSGLLGKIGLSTTLLSGQTDDSAENPQSNEEKQMLQEDLVALASPNGHTTNEKESISTGSPQTKDSPTTPSSDEPSDENKTSTILRQLQLVYDSRPDYKLYIAGHSLGGALALITALEAATRFSLIQGKPTTTCITLGNPKAGGVAFRQAIRSLEEKGKLRVLCVHNANDIVPMLPNSLCCTSYNFQRYKHVGMQLRVEENSNAFNILYRGRQHGSRKLKRREGWRRLSVIFPGLHRIAERHFYGSYLDALLSREKALSGMFLNDYYRLENVYSSQK